MRKAMKFRIAISALLFTAGTISYGQAIPAGGSAMSSGSARPNLPTPDGVLHYALSASEIVQFGYYGPSETTYATVLSGNVAYTGTSTAHPFNSIVTGGIIFGNRSGQGTQFYTSGSVSQGLVTRNWVFNISDSLSFLPQSPTTEYGNTRRRRSWATPSRAGTGSCRGICRPLKPNWQHIGWQC
jgi:hypothetical protein